MSGYGDVTYSGARRELRILLDRQTASLLDEVAEELDQRPEYVALTFIRRGLGFSG